MKPWDPYAMTFHGQPIVGQTPPKLVVYGPPLTAQQGAMLQTAYNAFVGAARVSIVPNPTRQGRLLDGSQYTIECSGASCTCTVWTVGAGGDDRNSDIANGVLRLNGAVNTGTLAAPKWLLHEFKQNEGPNNKPPAYKDTAVLYSDKTTPPAPALVGDPVWEAFSSVSLSGPAAILAQFGRGACAAYAPLLRARGVSVAGRSLGDGVVVLQHGGAKHAFCYRWDGGDLRATPMQIVPASEMGVALPPEIAGLFGGVPLPPTPVQWSSGETLATAAKVRDTVGDVTAWGMHGPQMSFPRFASTGDGATAHFVETYRNDTGMPAGSTIIYGSLVAIEFSVNAQGKLTAQLSRIEHGIVRAFATAEHLPIGTHTGPIGVTHVGGELTVFRRELIVRNYAHRTLPDDSGPWFTPTIMKVRVYWDGGASGSVTTFAQMEYESITGAASFSGTWSKISERTGVYETPPDQGIIKVVTYYETWRYSEQVSASSSIEAREDPDRGDVRGLGVEGMYHHYRAQLEGNYSHTLSGTASRVYEYEIFCGSITYYGVDGEYGIFDEHRPYVPPPNRSGSEQFVWFADAAYIHTNTGDSPTTVGGAMLRYGYNAEQDKYVWAFDSDPWVRSYTIQVTAPQQKYGSDAVVADGQVLGIGGMAVLTQFETPQHVNEVSKPEGRALLQISPIYLIRDLSNRIDRFPLVGRRSQLGGAQAIVKLFAYSQRHGQMRSWATTKGSLVETGYDREYDAAVDATFVGVLQP